MSCEENMTPRKFRLHDGKKGAAMAVRVTPRASKNRIVDILSDGTVKIHLTAPPVEGKANEALVKFLASILNVPVSRVEIVALIRLARWVDLTGWQGGAADHRYSQRFRRSQHYH